MFWVLIALIAFANVATAVAGFPSTLGSGNHLVYIIVEVLGLTTGSTGSPIKLAPGKPKRYTPFLPANHQG
jgi:hypothetical protein